MTQETNRILVPIDGSDASWRALDMATQIAKEGNNELEVLTVLDLSQIDVFDGFYLTEEQLVHLHERLQKNILDKALDKIGDDVKVHTTLERGRALPVIMDVAERDHVRMVVVGRTGRGMVDRIMQGSVSRGLGAKCKKPVLLVP